MARRRFFRYGELPLVLVALLSQEPRSGYDLLSELERLFGPAYHPSPGSVYPALRTLAAEGLVEATEADGSATYHPTDAGLEMLADRREELATVEHRTGTRLLLDDGVDAAFAALRARIDAVRGRLDEDRIITELRTAADELESAAAAHHQLEGRP